MARVRFGKVLWVTTSLFFIFICFSGYSIWTYSNKNELVKSDAAIVLGAAAWHDKPSPVLQERVNHAIWLYENGYVDKIIFTGGKGDQDEHAESEVARDYAINNNVKEEDILIETKSKITEENLTYAYGLARKNKLKTFILVSDPLHMKRAMLMAKHRGMVIHSSPTPTSAYKTLKSKLPFFFRELFFYVGYIVSRAFI